ncbi:MAG: DUF6364 family protein [Gemmatimonadaceae bacterium]
MAKSAKNLYLDPEVIERGEEYGRRHGTNISRLVSDFLRALPLDHDPLEVAPALRRLIGAGRPKTDLESPVGVDEYHEHLATKYGRR